MKCDFDDTFFNPQVIYFQVYDGSLTSVNLIGKGCGYIWPSGVTSSSNLFYLRFHSNEFINMRGFQAVVTFRKGRANKSKQARFRQFIGLTD